jgi:hypothetical protein
MFGTVLAILLYSSSTNSAEQQERQTMGKMRENPRYNVISMRISDEERYELESLVSMTDKSVSDIMREAMFLFKTRLQTLEFERRAA